MGLPAVAGPVGLTRPMRLLFAEVYDAGDPRTWSGSPAQMIAALRAADVDVVVVDRLMAPWTRGLEALRRGLQLTGAPRWLWEREPWVLSAHAARVHRAAEAMAADVVLSPGTLPVSALPPGRPLVVWTDATFAGLVGYYDEYTGLASRSLRVGHAAERRALSRADLLAYSSDWAAESARECYGADTARVAVVPFGAVVSAPGAEVTSLVSARAGDALRLLFVGVDWERKGAAVAVQAAASLAAAGWDVHLDVVGCLPPAPAVLRPGVTFHGFLRTEDPAERRVLHALLRKATVMVVPSRAECFGLVYAEAAAWGLPVVAVRTGGVPTVVQDGVTGRLVKDPPTAEDVAAAVVDVVSDRARYAAMAVAARRRHESVLNWRSAVDALLERIEPLVGR